MITIHWFLIVIALAVIAGAFCAGAEYKTRRYPAEQFRKHFGQYRNETSIMQSLARFHDKLDECYRLRDVASAKLTAANDSKDDESIARETEAFYRICETISEIHREKDAAEGWAQIFHMGHLVKQAQSLAQNARSMR